MPLDDRVPLGVCVLHTCCIRALPWLCLVRGIRRVAPVGHRRSTPLRLFFRLAPLRPTVSDDPPIDPRQSFGPMRPDAPSLRTLIQRASSDRETTFIQQPLLRNVHVLRSVTCDYPFGNIADFLWELFVYAQCLLGFVKN